MSVNTTSAYLFRKVSSADGAPTILYDEIDTVFGPKAKENEDIRVSSMPVTVKVPLLVGAWCGEDRRYLKNCPPTVLYSSGTG